MKAYEIINHTADLGIRVYAKDLKQLFLNSANALFELMVERTKKEQFAQKEEHRKYILDNHPDSDYALLLRNPKGFKERMDKKNAELETLYQQTYNLFLNNECDKVIENVKISENQYERNDYEPQFQYLKTICNGREGSITEFKELLEAFITKYKKEDVAQHANNVLAYLNKMESEKSPISGDSLLSDGSAGTDTLIAKSPFSQNNESFHYFIFAFPPNYYNANDLKISFSNFIDPFW